MWRFKNFLYVLIASSFVFVSCEKDEDPTGPNGNGNGGPGNPEVRISNYFANAPNGDIYLYEVNGNNKSIKAVHEKTGAAVTFNYTINNHGVYEFVSGGRIHYAIELPGKMFATTLYSGNHLSFGVSSETNLSTVNPAGRFAWINFPLDDYFSWGGFELLANNTWTAYAYDDEDEPQNIQFSGTAAGTWNVSPTDNSRILLTEGDNNMVGTVLPGKLIVISSQHEFESSYIVGLNYPASPSNQAQIAGSYRMITVTPEGIAAGHIAIPSSGNITAYSKEFDGTPVTVTMAPAQRFNNFNNIFISSATIDGDLTEFAFFVLPGEVLIFVAWSDEDGIVAYGYGCK